MKATLFITLFLSLSLAQAQPNNEIPTTKGPIRIQPVKHASMVLTWNNQTIYVDPTEPALYKGMKAPDLVIITDIHQDHMDMNALNALTKPGTRIVAPQAVADLLRSAGRNVIIISNGNEISLNGITISAVPMYNLPEAPEAHHPKGRGNGYILKMGGKNIYISGDTEDIPEMRELTNIDVAFICMNLPYTMDIKQAAAAVLAFKPAIVYPYHYRGQDPEAFKKLVNEGDRKIEVRVRNWYPN